MKRFQNLCYLLYFWPLAGGIGVLTALLSLARFKCLVAWWHGWSRNNRVLYLEVFFPENAGYHYRTRKWADILNRNGFAARVKYVFEKAQFERLMAEQRIVFFHTVFLFRRIGQCLSAPAYGTVIVRRELLMFNDYGNLFLEKFLLALHPNVMLDFDDDIAAAKHEPRQITWFGRLMREAPSKFAASLRLYPRFIVGTSYLKQFVLERNPKLHDADVLVIPTCVDYERYPPKVYKQESDDAKVISFGWVGSNATMAYLDIIAPALNEVARRHTIRVIVVGGRDYQPAEPHADFEVVNVPWSLAQEIENLRTIDIGLMPLYDTAAERGKCGFKLVQYMGMGIVSIASAITVNNQIVDDGRNGFLVRDPSQWSTMIEEVLARKNEFPAIGAAARDKIRSQFSFTANTENYLAFLRAGLPRTQRSLSRQRSASEDILVAGKAKGATETE